jgi:hypothetical protein
LSTPGKDAEELAGSFDVKIVAVTPGSAAASGQPMLIYSAAYDEFVFVSSDRRGSPPDNVVETHGREKIADPRNLFVLQPQGSDRYRIYNPSTGLWLFVSNDREEPHHVVEAHPNEAMERRIKKRNEFIFESAGNNQFLIYNPSYGEYLFVSDIILRGDNVVLSQSRRTDVRNRFTLVLP